ncbi:unnamed protein product [Parajaminaea phylloscopi]
MATTTNHNKKSSAVKRILSEARELEADASREYHAAPLESNIFEWHFTLRGPQGSEFESGLYHGRIILPAEYPFRPPSLMLLTPNGRWECNKKICLTFTGFHEEMWQPAWGIRTALLGVQAFMAARAAAATGVGSLDYPVEERTKLADKSRQWACSVCEQTNIEILPAAAEAGERKRESLPDGLQVDVSGKKASVGSEEEDAKSPAPSSNETNNAAASQPAALAPETQRGETSAPRGTSQSSSPTVAGAGAAPSNFTNRSDLSRLSKQPGNGGGPQTTAYNHSTTIHGPSCSAQRTPLPASVSNHEPATGARHPVRDDSSGESTDRVVSPNRARYQQFLDRPPNREPRLEDLRPTPTSRGPAVAPTAAPQNDTANAAARRARPPTRSEARVAQLDRAILTVVLLLCGLVVRRLL